MKKCTAECILKNRSCKQKDCRMWIDYKQNLNCTMIAVEELPEMTYKEIAKRLKVSSVRIKQIHDKALQKLQQNNLFFH